MGIQCGGDQTWQGGRDNSGKWVKGSTILDGFKKLPKRTAEQFTPIRMTFIRQTLRVVIIGEKPYAEYEGDEEKLDLYSGKALRAIEALSMSKDPYSCGGNTGFGRPE